jgi:tetratricopeptide (TPR) repeat protein
MRPRCAIIIVLALAAAGCAAKNVRPAGATIADADRLAASGCYTCLVDALRIYDAALQVRPTSPLVKSAFRTAILLSLREKEIGLPSAAHLDRARELAPMLPPAENAQLALAVSDSIPPDVAARSKDDYEDFILHRHARAPAVRGWRESLAPLLADPFMEYLDLSLDCEYGEYTGRGERVLGALDRHPGSLMIAYRVGSCGPQFRSNLDNVLSLDSRYLEAQFFLGRYALADSAVGKGSRRAAEPNLQAAYEAFPKSAAVTFTIAGLYRALSKLDVALRFYDETMALVPRHREALLGRIISLTYLNAPEDAIASATQLIEWGTWYLGDGYYWRAYNERQLQRLDAARDDAEQARKLLDNSDAFALAGIVYFDRKQFDPAAADLLAAVRKATELGVDNCMARWYLGLVLAEQKKWTDAGGVFERGAACYRSSADMLKAELQRVQTSNPDAQDVAAVTAEYQRQIDEALAQEARSLFNVAYASAQIGERDRALNFAGRAAAHPLMNEKATALIAALKKVSR